MEEHRYMHENRHVRYIGEFLSFSFLGVIPKQFRPYTRTQSKQYTIPSSFVFQSTNLFPQGNAGPITKIIIRFFKQDFEQRLRDKGFSGAKAGNLRNKTKKTASARETILKISGLGLEIDGIWNDEER